ncbi:hypothetical protein PR202_ga16132 [Eleusine coracana subsp. coracana]|uniref:F-box protein AT5G49610-like beta-propeller domain-containing protein n=1 Tax=Eleusine coracana subsp. coracana TaxID=191504 RepID=A0AAV5CKU4_ELECO|nr:hypothetical protein PR202_ga16132 [Eleusine coracana subsp. coracana]
MSSFKVLAALHTYSRWEVDRREATSALPGRKPHYFKDDDAVIIAADDAHVLLTPYEETWLFSVELETMEVELDRVRNRYAGPAYPCKLPWPPALEQAMASRGIANLSLYGLKFSLYSIDISTLQSAASACKRWHHVVADPEFLARFRSLCAPPVAGHFHTVDPYYVSGKPPRRPVVFLPSPKLAVDRRRFSLDFLPVSKDKEWTWRIADSRGSLVLLVAEERKPERYSWKWMRRTKPAPSSRPDIVVCEPVTRRHQLILLPRHLTPSCCFGFFLLDGDGGSIGMASFRVVALLNTYVGDQPPESVVFTSGRDGGWRVPAGDSGIRLPVPAESLKFLGRANGAVHWATGYADMLVLDEATLEFSEPELPDDTFDRRDCRVIDAEDDALRVMCVQDKDLKLFVRMDDDEWHWHVEKTLRLPEATSKMPGHKARFFHYQAMIVAVDSKHVLLTSSEETWLFSVELETMTVERNKERNRYPGPVYPYELPWPPVLEPRLLAPSHHQAPRRLRRQKRRSVANNWYQRRRSPDLEEFPHYTRGAKMSDAKWEARVDALEKSASTASPTDDIRLKAEVDAALATKLASLGSAIAAFESATTERMDQAEAMATHVVALKSVAAAFKAWRPYIESSVDSVQSGLDGIKLEISKL